MTSPLADSPSPFLRHGAEQPVNWLPWGEEAFRRAREGDRPVLLDIGAVWCHWCHVMDRESYEDSDTAALINELYVPVKVDRDERPDVDSRYQRAVQTLVGQGGWPLTGFLTPDGDVFHGGTYFPPEDAHGRPSFRRVLREVARVWSEERHRVEDAASAIRERLQVVLTGEAAAGELKEEMLDDAVASLSRVYDDRNGGFGGAPKFPNAGALGLLLDRWLESETVETGGELAGGRRRVHRMLDHTLRAMADGGMFDQLGGGFHRYSTDARWIIPHFEKMAYDNGPLLELYARAAVALDEPRYRDVAERIVAHYRDVAPELVEQGGFPASQDADIGFDDDGDHWTWTAPELRDVLNAAGLQDAVEPALSYWGLRDPGSAMHLSPSRHVLFRAASLEEVARSAGASPEEVRSLLDRAAEALKAARDQRPAPYLDRTLYSGWVGLVASGHLSAARHLGLDEAGHAALRALERVWAEAWHEGEGLVHRLGDPATGIHLTDQAHVAQALTDAFEWSQQPQWLERAETLVRLILDRFSHPSGGLQDVPRDHPQNGEAEAQAAAPRAAPGPLRQPRLEVTDSPEPSPNAVAAMTLSRLAALLHDDDLTSAARRVVAAYAGSAPRFAPNAGTWFRALRWVVRPATTVVVVERGGASAGAQASGALVPHGPLLRAALESYRPGSVVRRLEPDQVESVALPEPMRAMVTGEAPRAYVCTGPTCLPPVQDPRELRDLLRSA